MMRRRTCVAVTLGALAAPFAAEAQPAARVHRIGFVSATSANPSNPQFDAFRTANGRLSAAEALGHREFVLTSLCESA